MPMLDSLIAYEASLPYPNIGMPPSYQARAYSLIASCTTMTLRFLECFLAWVRSHPGLPTVPLQSSSPLEASVG